MVSSLLFRPADSILLYRRKPAQSSRYVNRPNQSLEPTRWPLR